MDPLSLLAGPVIGAATQLIGGASANSASAASAQKQMDFQERMSDTQYQRTVADMKAAGLNPMLAAFSGSVDSAPSGASYSAQNIASGFAGAGAQVGQEVLQNNAQPSQIANTESDTSLNQAKIEAQKLANKLTVAQTKLTSSNARVSGYEGDMMEPVASFVKTMTPEAVDYFRNNLWPSFKKGVAMIASGSQSALNGGYSAAQWLWNFFSK